MASLKLAIILFLIVAGVSIFGTVIPQEVSPAQYLQIFGPTTYNILDKLEVFNLYHSWWFIALFVLLGLNLAACSLTRLFRAFRSNWNYFKIGTYLIHFGFLLILIGALLTFLLGFKGEIRIVEGETTSEIYVENNPLRLGFELGCDDFSVSYYPNGAPKEYKSILTIKEEGKTALRREVKVNHPLTHKGITFYQSSFGPAGDPKVVITIREKGKEKILEGVIGERINIPDSEAFIYLIPLITNPKNPKVRVVLFKPGRFHSIFSLERGHPVFKEGLWFELRQFEERQYTGLEVNKDPGVWWVWVGSTLMFLGFIPTLLSSYGRMLRKGRGT